MNLGKESEKIEYNEKLLGYSGVEIKEDTMEEDFQKQKEIIQIILWIMIFLLAFIMLYSIFYLSTLDNQKLYASFLSFGMKKSQIIFMLIIQLIIFLIISLPIGLIVGIGIWNFLGIFINSQIQGIQGFEKDFFRTNWIDFVTLSKEISLKIIIKVCTTITFLLGLSILKPIINIKKFTLIEQIRANTIKKDEIKKSKMANLYKKIFGIEGQMAYYNKIRNRFQSFSILSICIVTLVCANILYGYIVIFYNRLIAEDHKYGISYQYIISSSEKKNEEIIENIINELKNQNLIDVLFGISYDSSRCLAVDNQHMSPQIQNLMNHGKILVSVNENLLLTTNLMILDEQTNSKYLNKARIN